MDIYSKDTDSLYREPKDGLIALKRDEDRIEFITLIDLSTLWEEKQNFGWKIAKDLAKLNHPNILNIT